MELPPSSVPNCLRRIPTRSRQTLVAATRQPRASGAGRKVVLDERHLGDRTARINGGPQFPLNAPVSLYVLCDNQVEVDH
jgi:predicted 3-demethylubiquinone-9 3-methyltransferase (glyoxalase superfamily)